MTNKDKTIFTARERSKQVQPKQTPCLGNSKVRGAKHDGPSAGEHVIDRKNIVSIAATLYR